MGEREPAFVPTARPFRLVIVCASRERNIFTAKAASIRRPKEEHRCKIPSNQRKPPDHQRNVERHYDQYKIRIGRSLLLGLEALVAADIVKTIAIELTFTSLGLLAGLVIVRTFLGLRTMVANHNRLLPNGIRWLHRDHPQSPFDSAHLETPRPLARTRWVTRC